MSPVNKGIETNFGDLITDVIMSVMSPVNKGIETVEDHRRFRRTCQ